ncbi:homoserine O-acetyltransferase [Aestuariibacter sp. A3R04]|uniref:E22 family MetX-like putative esterase n=1 Tax=Aestuariibacter sp. A3R04 TaxID=2841571 RepID=UPI001C086D45|nr:homoserine O-acetyltransferase [Aestuariibacter sp. A3R04]MBU3022538.1 homoserine O-acetyltransferase [Aestuariibacter sp. A3R04]
MKVINTLIFILLFIATQVSAQTLLTKKQTFTTSNFSTFGGQTLPQVTVGWESYGTLNENKDNVILITHFFTGNSHAAGKYREDDTQYGYWDAIIGPGKAIDTNRFFVISVDSLANLGVHNPNVHTTGPASINPQTQRPYGLSFPVVTIRDFVNVQKALLQSLGISSLYAVIGPSMGSMQAMDWAATYPDWVSRMVAVIAAGQSDAWTTATLEQWATPIKLDPKWQQGNYTVDDGPVEGLAASLMLITQQALTPEFFNLQGKALDYSPIESAPLHDILAKHSIVDWLYQRAKQRADEMDANHLLYLVRACQLFIAGHNGNLEQAMTKIKAKTLFLPAENDLLLLPYMAELPHELLLKQGKNTQISTLKGQLGHLEGVMDIQEKADVLRAFLQE